MQSLLQTIKEIQIALKGTNLKYNIDLPRIAVVGAQSSGKSSVLESIVGEDFLPRGTDIVTRWPLELTLVNKDGPKSAVFDHLPEQTFTNFDDVWEEIQNRTNELAGSDKKIVKESIFLTVYSPIVPNLRLVDLPGLTKVQMDDQDSNIVESIENLVNYYIKNNNTIILAISPANNDIANSDGLQFASKVDPDRERTLGVLTKIDIMDEGTNAREYLLGTKYNLKHGYVGVKCRSQADNMKGKSILDSIHDERSFFENHPDYTDISNTQGTEYLAYKLSTLLQEHIKKNLPTIEELLEKNLTEYKQILGGLGEDPSCEDYDSAQKYITKLIDEYCRSYYMVLEGSAISSKITRNYGGGKIYKIFEYFYTEKIEPIDPLSKMTNKMILNNIYDSYGMRPGLFIPEVAWSLLIKDHISEFTEPSNECAENVYKILEQAVAAIMPHKLHALKPLKSYFIEKMEDLLKTNYSKLLDVIKDKIDSEVCYMNYNNDDFKLIKPYIEMTDEIEESKLDYLSDQYKIDQSLFIKSEVYQDIDNEVRREQSSKRYTYESTEAINNNLWKVNDVIEVVDGIKDSDREKIMSMKRVIHSYFSLLKKSFKDSIPKFIVKFLVQDTLDEMRSHLQSKLPQGDALVEMTSEDPEIKNKRDNAVEYIKKVEKSLRAIRKVKTYN